MNLEAILPSLSCQQLHEAACEAAAAGHLEVLSKFQAITRASDGYCWALGTRQCKAAAKAGRIDVLTWLHDHVHHSCWTTAVCAVAAKANQLASLCWLRTICNPPCPWDATTFVCAASAGNLQMFYLLLTLDPPCPWNSQVCAEAARHPDCLKWLRRQQAPPCPWTASCFEAAALAGDLSLMQWMRAQRQPCPMDSGAMHAAAHRGDLSMVVWLCRQDPRCPCDERAIYAAINLDHLEIVQLLRQQDPPCHQDNYCMMLATERGSKGLTMLQWILAHDPPCPLRPFMTECCIRTGDLPMLQWLHEAGYALSPRSVNIAAAAGHTHLLWWLLSIGMRPDVLISPSAWSAPIILLWGDSSLLLNARLRKLLIRARSTFCTFHGLVRWCSRNSSSTISTSNEDDRLLRDPYPFCQHGSPGQLLLTDLARLPVEIVRLIAMAAKLQHDLPVQSFV